MDEIYNLLEFYYQKNPDSMLPLLMAAAASRDKLEIRPARNPLSWEPQKGIDTELATHIALFSINLDDASAFDWISTDKDFETLIRSGKEQNALSLIVNVKFDHELVYYMTKVLDYENEFLPRFHFKQGHLVHHSFKEKEETLLRNYAGMRLAFALNHCDKQLLQKDFVNLSNKIMEMASIQPKRDRMSVVRTLNALLDYNGTGTVYVPFAGTGLLPAMIGAGKNMYADGSFVDHEYTAGLLVNYGAGGSNEHFEQKNSYNWCGELNPDYIACTYLGNTESDSDKHAMSFCLEQCMKNKDWHGRLAATIQAQYIFDYSPNKDNPETLWWINALKKNWVDIIIALPIGEVCVLFDGKREKKNKEITFIDCTNPLIEGREVKDLLKLDIYHQTVKVKDAMKTGFLKSLIAPEVHTIKGFTNTKLSDILSPLKKDYHLIDDESKDAKIQVSLNGTSSLKRTIIKALYEPSYHLTQDCIIIPCAGCPKPVFFDSSKGDAYLTEGYAFVMNNPEDKNWIMKALEEEYVIHQLHPYGYNALTPPHFEITEFLDLTLRKQNDKNNSNGDALPKGFVIKHGDFSYEIGNKLGSGGFGITYEATESNSKTGEKRDVALKELFMKDINTRHDGGKVKTREKHYSEVCKYRKSFRQEAKLMAKLGAEPTNHIMHVEREFKSTQTGTYYYVMKKYSKGSLNEMVWENRLPPEDVVLTHIIEPLCKAIRTIHDNNCLHLDIKPENILLDDDGYATLIDFGLVKKYKKNGMAQRDTGQGGTIIYEAPEQHKGNMGKFEKRADLYSLAATLFFSFTLDYAYPIPPADTSIERELRNKMGKLSPKFQNAIIKGLQESPSDRPSSIDDFLKMFA